MGRWPYFNPVHPHLLFFLSSTCCISSRLDLITLWSATRILFLLFTSLLLFILLFVLRLLHIRLILHLLRHLRLIFSSSTSPPRFPTWVVWVGGWMDGCIMDGWKRIAVLRRQLKVVSMDSMDREVAWYRGPGARTGAGAQRDGAGACRRRRAGALMDHSNDRTKRCLCCAEARASTVAQADGMRQTGRQTPTGRGRPTS